jgi:hypothetical protein
VRGVTKDTGAEEGKVMKAFLALVLIYVAVFLVAIQGASQSPVQAAHQAAPATQHSSSIDPAKETDIRSLMELVGARDLVQDATARGVEQFRENLLTSLAQSDRGEQFVNTFTKEYQQKFNPDEVTNQLVGIYDKHFTDDDIRGLLQFYGSPLGQKLAKEMPKIMAETQAADRAVSTRVAKEVLQDLRKQYPGIGTQARLVRPRAARREQGNSQSDTQPETQASASQP